MQLGCTFGGEGWVKMWSKSDSEKKKTNKREIDKVLSGSLGTQKALPAVGGMGQGAGGSKDGVVGQDWGVWRCLSPAGNSRAWAGWEGSSPIGTSSGGCPGSAPGAEFHPNEKQSSQTELISPRGHFPGCTQPQAHPAKSLLH